MDLFLLQRMSLSLGADVKVVCIPALVSERLRECAISGMYCKHAYGLNSSSSTSSSSLKGRMRKRFLDASSHLYRRLRRVCPSIQSVGGFPLR